MVTWVGRRGAIVWISLLAIATAACGSASTTVNKPAPLYPTQDPRAVSGGSLTIGVWQPPSSFLNAGVVDSQPFSYAIDAPVAEGLLWYRSPAETAHAKSPADYYQPWLATEVPTLANHDVQLSGCPNLQAAMCVTWKLRSGVQWDDGSYLSSQDVCDTYNLYWLQYQGKNPTSLVSTTTWDQTLDCKTQGNLTAVIDYKHTVGAYLSLGTGVMGIMPAAELEPALATGKSIEAYAPNIDLSLGSHNTQAYQGSTLTLDQMVDGTGPYVFQSASANDIVYVKNNNYWNKAHQPHIGKLIFKNEPDLSTELRDAEKGATDVALNLDLNDYSTVSARASQRNPTLRVQTVLGSGAEKIDINLCGNDTALGSNLCGPQAMTSAYTADGTVRKAILQGIDRPNILKRQAQGLSSIPKNSWMYLGAGWIGSAQLAQTKYNPGAARDELDAAGDTVSVACGTDSAGDKFRAFKDGTCIAVKLGNHRWWQQHANRSRSPGATRPGQDRY